MDTNWAKKRLGKAVSAAAIVMAASAPAQAVVLLGGNNGWEISFDGVVGGFYNYFDSSPAPATFAVFDGSGALLNPGIDPTTLLTAGQLGDNTQTSRVRTGLSPAFFSFNVKSPTVAGLTGSARISFAPAIQNADGRTKNTISDAGEGARIDTREVFFNIEGNFGTFSIGRTVSLFQRKTYLADMTWFGMGVSDLPGGQASLGRAGYGYLYPNWNARIAYKTPQVNGFQLELGVFDPAVIRSFAGASCAVNRLGASATGFCADNTEKPRFEGEASYATAFNNGTFQAFVSGLWQEADGQFTNAGLTASRDRNVTAWGLSGGVQLGYKGFEVLGAGYTGRALGSTLMLDQDAIDRTGEERDHNGWLAQGTYTWNKQTKIGFSYGESTAKETGTEQADRLSGFNGAQLKSQTAYTGGVYHNVTSWFKLTAEYTRAERKWFNGAGQDANIYSVGGFFLW